MRFKSEGNKKDNVIVTVKNSSSTITIKAGAPCFFKEELDGLQVVSSENLAAANQVGFAGFAINDIPVSTDPKPFSEAIAFGQTDLARFLTRTRAATTDSWASQASIAAFVLLAPNTGVSSAGPSIVQALQTTAAALAGFIMVLMQSIASSASQASSYNSGFLSEVRTVKVLVRAL